MQVVLLTEILTQDLPMISILTVMLLQCIGRVTSVAASLFLYHPGSLCHYLNDAHYIAFGSMPKGAQLPKLLQCQCIRGRKETLALLWVESTKQSVWELSMK